jgi:hypothetical protein
MPWWDGLSAETLRELRARFPDRSFDQIGIIAARNPRYASEFERLGVTVWTYTGDEHSAFLYSPDDPDHIEYPERSEAAVRALIVAAAIEDDTSGRKRRGPAFRAYDGARVEIAVRMLRPSETEPGRNKAARSSGLPTRPSTESSG